MSASVAKLDVLFICSRSNEKNTYCRSLQNPVIAQLFE